MFRLGPGLKMFLGLGGENQVLDSAEFYDLTEDKWTQTSALKVGRTGKHLLCISHITDNNIGRLSD